jgi:hypothetical protein
MSKLHCGERAFPGMMAIGFVMVAMGCGGGRAGEGTGGSPFGGQGGTAAGGGVTGQGGADPLAMGPGIPTDGDAYCLADRSSGPDLTFEDVRRCIIGKKIGGPATDAEKTDFCPRVGGTPVAACPANDIPVAYCKLLSYSRPGVGQVPFDVTAVIEKSPVSPSAAAVVREQQGTAVSWCDGATYDTANHHVVATCAGTLSASVDGVPIDFSTDIRCSFVGDGDRALFLVSGNAASSDLSRFLALTVSKDGTELSLKPSLEYVETPTATGTPVYYTPPADGRSVSYQSQAFDMMGEVLSGAFSFGTVASESGITRVVSAGQVNVTFTVQ